MYVAPNSVSGRVVKTVSASSRPCSPKSTSAPSLRPIQLVCMSLICSGQSIVPRSSSRRCAYSVMRRYHCSRFFLVTSLPQRQHLPCSTCSLARMVLQLGHHHCRPVERRSEERRVGK